MHIKELTTVSDPVHVRAFLLSDRHTSCKITIESLEDNGFPLDLDTDHEPVTVKQCNREVATDLALLASALLPHLGHELPTTP